MVAWSCVQIAVSKCRYIVRNRHYLLWSCELIQRNIWQIIIFQILFTALTSSVASVCNTADVNCLDSYSFPQLEGLHRASLNHNEALGFTPNGPVDPDCLNLLGAGFYHSDLGQLGACATDCERPPSKRLKLSLSEPFNQAAVGNLGLDYEAATRAHHITSAKMAVSVTDFGSRGSGEANSYMGVHSHAHTHTLHQQHTAVQSE